MIQLWVRKRWGMSIGRLDRQVLCDPPEEELFLPSGLGQFRIGESWKGNVVGQAGPGLASGFVPDAHATELARVVAGCAWVGKDDGLVAEESGGAVDSVGVEAVELEVALGLDHEHSPAVIQMGKAWEVEVPAIHDVDGARLRQEHIQQSVVGEGGRGDPEVGGDAAIPLIVGIGQRTSGHAAPDAKVIEAIAKSPEASFDVSEAFPAGELGEDHAKELVPATADPNRAVAVVSKHDPAKEAVWEMGNERGEDGTAPVHKRLLARVSSQHLAHPQRWVQTADRARTP